MTVTKSYFGFSSNELMIANKVINNLLIKGELVYI